MKKYLESAGIPVAISAVLFLPGLASPFFMPKAAAFSALCGILGLYYNKKNPAFTEGGLRILNYALTAVLLAVFLPLFSAGNSIIHLFGGIHLLSGVFCFAICLLCFSGDSRDEHILVAADLAGFAGTITAMLAIAQALRLDPHTLTGTREFLAPSTFGNPNMSAAFLAPLVPLLTGLYFFGPMKYRRYPVMTAIIFSGIIATDSKGGILAAFIGLTTLAAWKMLPQRMLKYFIICSLSVPLLLFLCTGSVNLVAMPQFAVPRLFLWESAKAVFIDNFLTGTGLNQFPGGFLKHAPGIFVKYNSSYFPHVSVEYAHSDFLQYAAEGGFFVIGIFLIFIIYVLFSAEKKDKFYAAGSASVITLLSLGMIDPLFRNPSTLGLFWLCTSVIVTGKKSTIGKPNKTRLFLYAFSIIFILNSIRILTAETLWTANYKTGDLTLAAELYPENAHLRSSNARHLNAVNKYPEALEEINKALLLYYNYRDDFFRIRMTGKNYGAGKEKQEWEKMNRDLPFLLTPKFELGKVAQAEKDYTLAIRYYREIIDASVNNSTSQAPLRSAAKKRIDSITKIMKKNPDAGP